VTCVHSIPDAVKLIIFLSLYFAPTLIATEKLIAHFANEQVSGQGNSAFAIPHVTFDM
jgi:hypothetical protein